MRRVVDAVVVVLILLVAAGLVVPAVVRVRGEERRVDCQNNLRQMGLALHNYHGTHHNFPPATVPSPRLPPERRLSWYVETFPYVEQAGLVIDRDKPWDAEENLEPMVTGVEMPPTVLGECRLFLCPGNPSRSSPGRPGLIHYVGIAGAGPDTPGRSAGYPGVGVFGHNRKTSLEDIADGAATTLLALETARDNGPWTAGGPPTVRGLDPARPPYIGVGGQFGGTHRRGANALFADGSVHFLPEGLDSRVLEALATIAGGEQVAPGLGD